MLSDVSENIIGAFKFVVIKVSVGTIVTGTIIVSVLEAVNQGLDYNDDNEFSAHEKGQRILCEFSTVHLYNSYLLVLFVNMYYSYHLNLFVNMYYSYIHVLFVNMYYSYLHVLFINMYYSYLLVLFNNMY
jgi:hypothetical protein